MKSNRNNKIQRQMLQKLIESTCSRQEKAIKRNSMKTKYTNLSNQRDKILKEVKTDRINKNIMNSNFRIKKNTENFHKEEKHVTEITHRNIQ